MDFKKVKVNCPCCGALVNAPTFEMFASANRLTRMQSSILRGVWSGKGLAVHRERIYDYMYSDDPDGGPSPRAMRVSLKVNLCKLRNNLMGSGIGIESLGYRLGYRLVLGELSQKKGTENNVD